MLLPFVEAAILAAGCSLDAFTVSFAYGTKKIRIPLLSNQIINLICSGVLGLSLMAGAYVRQSLPDDITKAISLIVLFSLGALKLLDSATKTIIRGYNKAHNESFSKEIKFTMLNFRFILNLYANPEDADIDASKDISPSEAVALAVSLSLDGLAVGIGAALGNISVAAMFLASLLTNTAAVALGALVGNKIASRVSMNLSWLSGVILIGLAAAKALL